MNITMNIKMFGEFSILFKGKELEFDKNQTTKSMQLLQILLYFGESGISRKWLLNNLYSKDEVSNPANNLRVTAHRLRKMISDSELPEYEYIKLFGGKYFFTAPFKIKVDTTEFESKLKEAKMDESIENKISTIKSACDLYKGDFLPMLTGEDWAVIESVRLQEKYFSEIRFLCNYYKEHKDYYKVVDLCEHAIEIFPLEEWFIEEIDCLIELKKYNTAVEVYEKAANLFFEEFGVSPSDAMITRFRELSSEIKNVSSTLDLIKESLSEQKLENGAFYCSYPSFIDNYRMVSRIIQRSGQSVYIMLCSIVENDGTLMENPKKLQIMSLTLKNAIQSSLRLGDVITRYSSNQFLVLLLDTNKESCSVASNRILKRFTEEHKSWRNNVIFNEASVLEIEKNDRMIKFNDSIWSE